MRHLANLAILCAAWVSFAVVVAGVLVHVMNGGGL